MSSRRQRSIPLGGRYRQVSLYMLILRFQVQWRASKPATLEPIIQARSLPDQRTMLTSRYWDAFLDISLYFLECTVVCCCDFELTKYVACFDLTSKLYYDVTDVMWKRHDWSMRTLCMLARLTLAISNRSINSKINPCWCQVFYGMFFDVS